MFAQCTYIFCASVVVRASYIVGAMMPKICGGYGLHVANQVAMRSSIFLAKLNNICRGL